MITYKYSAISHDGQKVSGVVDGFNELDAVDRIKQDCDIVLKLTEVRENDGLGFLNMEIGESRLDGKAFTVMCSQFAIILNAGIPVGRAVQLIADKTTDKPLKKMLRQVADDVGSGRTMSASFEERGGRLLPVTFIETLRAGEESGSLDRSFASMAEHFDRQTKMKDKVKSALTYPAFVLAIAVIVVMVLMVQVVPTFTEMFAEMGGQLPLPTRMLIAVSDFFRKYILMIVIAVIICIIGYKLYGNTEEGRIRLARRALKLPVIGNIQELNAASQFANTFTAMLNAGLPIVKAIGITARTIDNYYISHEIGKLTGRLEEGRALGPSLREANIMPDILVDMVNVGEESGEMENTMRTVAGYYDNELEIATAAAVAKLEPTILIGLAAVAGFIVIAIYMAMFSMYALM